MAEAPAAVDAPAAAAAAGGDAPAASPLPPRPAAPAGGLSAATADKVVKQMEFYFSDSNLPRDKFMLERVHESAEGYVDIGLIATFARMREILKARRWRRECARAPAARTLPTRCHRLHCRRRAVAAARVPTLTLWRPPALSCADERATHRPRHARRHC